MDTTTNTAKRSHKQHSELERFKLFYEFATPTKDVVKRSRIQSTGK